MVLAEFAEKTFEVAYDIELGSGVGGTPTVFAPGQVLEHLVGFDASANPDYTHVIWRVIAASRPRGVTLLSEHWTGSPERLPSQAVLPTYPISFIVQFKRPEYLRGHRASQWRMWRAPYYRFTRDAGQQRVLKRLEINLSGDAIVRYAAPAFHTYQELDAARLARSVVARTGHVSPSVLANHVVWTYRSAGSSGRANPNGPRRPFERLSDMFREPDPNHSPIPPSNTTIARSDGMAAHVRALAQATTDKEPALRRSLDEWRGELHRAQVPSRDVAVVVDFAAIQTMMKRLGASWWLLDRNSLS